jgi:energy-coupling factor transporter ATP-binding protein EcfA2
MLLKHCDFEGLPGFARLTLPNLDSLTTLIGPNGAGKSTILRALHLALRVLERKTLCDDMPQAEPWDRCQAVTLRFGPDREYATSGLAEHLGATISEEVELRIECDASKFCIRRLRCDARVIEFTGDPPTKKQIQTSEEQVQSAQANLKRAKERPPQVQQKPPERGARIQKAEQDLETAKLARATVEGVSAVVSESGVAISLKRTDVDAALGGLLLPTVIYTGPRQSPEAAIPELIKKLMQLKKGQVRQVRAYDAAVKRLGHLLQAEADLFEANGKEELHVNGVPYQQASTGTETTLAFFGQTELQRPDCIILWDEPENGLHPTRRIRLLDLMMGDTRQYVLASHAAEFAPVQRNKGKVPETVQVVLSLAEIATRRDAFSALEALGVHPARALFTANVVIWVEGPTELLFFQHWLTRRLKSQNIIEGFHYTFVQYGGSLITYLAVADDAAINSFIDLLSICRHPVVIVDSDLSAPPSSANPQEFLKPGAARLHEEISRHNEGRSGSALFEITAGREIENYLPEAALWHAVEGVWTSYSTHKEALHGANLSVGQFDSYDDALDRHFVATCVTDVRSDGLSLAKGRTCWGSKNKVEMMREALTMEDLRSESSSGIAANSWNGSHSSLSAGAVPAVEQGLSDTTASNPRAACGQFAGERGNKSRLSGVGDSYAHTAAI